MSSQAVPRLMARLSELRRHQRVFVPVHGRYMLADQQEHPCQTVNMSPGGVALIAPVLGKTGERVVCYLEHFGRLEGRIVRVFSDGFALELIVPASKREKLADQLTFHANRSMLGTLDGRHHARIVPRNTRSILLAADGQEATVQVIDLSMSGVAIAGVDPLPLGTPVTLGRRAGRVARALDGMLGIEFLRLIPLEEFDETIVL